MATKSKPRVLIVYCNTPMEPLVPLGVACLATTLEENDIEVRIFGNTLYESIEDDEEHPELDITDDGDSQRNPSMSLQVKEVDFSSVGLVKSKNNMIDDFKAIVEEFQPNLIGLSCVELTLLTGLKLLESIKEKKIFNIVGGCVATFASEKVLSYDVTDSVCVGEGEQTMVQLARAIVNGDSLDNTPNFVYKKSKDTIHRSTNNFLIPTKDFGIPKFHFFQKERIWRPMDGVLYRMIPIEFSRGCPYKCTYCSAPSYNDKFADIGRWLRHKPMDQVITEIEYNIKKLNVEYFYFISETFLAIPKSIRKELYERYASIRIPFWFNTRPETITEWDIENLENIGCHRISIGLESGNEKFRYRLLKRDYTNGEMIRAAKLVSDSKIQVSVNNMIGFPDETREMIFDTIRLNKEFDLDSYSVSVFQPFIGTTLHKYCVEKNYWDENRLLTRSFKTPVLNMPQLSPAEIRGLYRTFNLYIHFDENRWPEIEQAEKFTPEGNEMFAKLCEEIAEQRENPEIHVTDEVAVPMVSEVAG